MIQQLGEAVSDGKDVEMDFGSVGRLLVREKEPRFSFSSAMLSGSAGDAMPMESADAGMEGGYQRSSAAAFRKDAPEEARGLGIQGGAPGRQQDDAPAATQPMPSMPPPMPAIQLDEGDAYQNEPPSRRSDVMSNAGE